MRRNDREITDLREILRLMDRCDVVNLAFADNGEPYVVPVNFGYVSDGETKAVLYFHGAREGRKASLAEKTGRAAFSMYASHTLELAGEGEPACRSTMKYSSVCGVGSIELVEDREEKRLGLNAIMGQYSEPDEQGFSYEEASVDAVAVWRLTVEEIHGKSSRKQA